MLEKKLIESIALIRINHGKVNAIDIELVEALKEVFQNNDDDSKAVILTGSAGCFSAGVDLHRLISSGETYIDRFLIGLMDCFEAVFAYPRPVVAAINGHAIAGGHILAAACDHRVMAIGRGRIGVPELLVGVPFPAAALELLRYTLPAPAFEEMILSGRCLEPDQALKKGLVNEIVPAEELTSQATKRCKEMLKIPEEIFARTKDELRGDTLERMRSARSNKWDEVRKIWTSSDTHSHIKKYLAQTLG